MDKTYNIGLGGFSFVIENAAYQKLKSYLSAIRNQLHNDEDREEIIADIECRIAELLKERLKLREVINTDDINFIVSTMGNPEVYNDSEEETSEKKQTASTSSFKRMFSSRRLYRDPDHRILGGVCSGLSYLWGIDRVWIRLAIILLPFIFGMLDKVVYYLPTTLFSFPLMSILFIYIILWIIVPKAITTSDKLQMRGEPVNVDSIKEFSENQRRVPERGDGFFLNLIKVILKIIGVLFLIFFFFICLSILIGFIALIFGVGIGFTTFGMTSVALSDYLPLLFNNQVEVWLIYLCTFFVIILPLIGIILLSIYLISSRFKVDKKITYGMLSTFFVSLIVLIVVGGLTLKNFVTEESIVTKKEIRIPSDTLIINNVTDFEGKRMNNIVELKNNKYAFKREDEEYLFVKPTNDSIPYFEIRLSAKGKNSKDAENNLSKIHYTPRVVGNNIYLNSFLSFEKDIKWREQKVDITLYLPEGKFISGKDFRDFVVKKDWNDYYDASDNQIYGFVNGEFTCVSCPKEDLDEEVENNDGDKIKQEKDHEIKIKVDSTNNRKKVEINAGPIKMKIEE